MSYCGQFKFGKDVACKNVIFNNPLCAHKGFLVSFGTKIGFSKHKILKCFDKQGNSHIVWGDNNKNLVNCALDFNQLCYKCVNSHIKKLGLKIPEKFLKEASRYSGERSNYPPKQRFAGGKISNLETDAYKWYTVNPKKWKKPLMTKNNQVDLARCKNNQGSEPTYRKSV